MHYVKSQGVWCEAEIPPLQFKSSGAVVENDAATDDWRKVGCTACQLAARKHIKATFPGALDLFPIPKKQSTEAA